jgi:hypothetical protein
VGARLSLARPPERVSLRNIPWAFSCGTQARPQVDGPVDERSFYQYVLKKGSKAMISTTSLPCIESNRLKYDMLNYVGKLIGINGSLGIPMY